MHTPVLRPLAGSVCNEIVEGVTTYLSSWKPVIRPYSELHALGLMLSKDDTQHPSQTCAPYFLQLPKLPVTLQGLKFNTSKFEIDRGFSGRASYQPFPRVEFTGSAKGCMT